MRAIRCVGWRYPAAGCRPMRRGMSVRQIASSQSSRSRRRWAESISSGCGCRWSDQAVDRRDPPLALGITLPEVLLEVPGEALRELRGQAGRGDQADRNPRLRRARALRLRRWGVDLDQACSTTFRTSMSPSVTASVTIDGTCSLMFFGSFLGLDRTRSRRTSPPRRAGTAAATRPGGRRPPPRGSARTPPGPSLAGQPIIPESAYSSSSR